MAKAIILNATEVNLTLTGKWRTGIGGSIKHSTSVTVKSFDSNYVDDVLYDMDIKVKNKKEKVESDSASIAWSDSYSFLAYRNSKDKNKIYLSHRYKLTDSYPTRMLVLAKATYKLKNLKDKTEAQKKQLEENLIELARHDIYVP